MKKKKKKLKKNVSKNKNKRKNKKTFKKSKKRNVKKTKVTRKKIPKKSKMNAEYSYTFKTPGIYFYQCTPHKVMGMIALVVVGDDISNKESISKVKVFAKGKEKLPELLGQLK